MNDNEISSISPEVPGWYLSMHPDKLWKSGPAGSRINPARDIPVLGGLLILMS